MQLDGYQSQNLPTDSAEEGRKQEARRSRDHALSIRAKARLSVPPHRKIVSAQTIRSGLYHRVCIEIQSDVVLVLPAVKKRGNPAV
jgi:hypothetical protein